MDPQMLYSLLWGPQNGTPNFGKPPDEDPKRQQSERPRAIILSYLANTRTLTFLGYLFGSLEYSLNFLRPGYWGREISVNPKSYNKIL